MSSNIKTNPREQVNVVSLRRGKELRVKEKQDGKKNAEKNKEKEMDDKPTQPMKEYKSKTPYPTKLKKDLMND